VTARTENFRSRTDLAIATRDHSNFHQPVAQPVALVRHEVVW